MSSTINLPLNFRNTSHFEIFIKAFEDKNLRTDLVANKANLPRGITQIINMSDDKKFLSKMKEILPLYQSFRKGEICYETMKFTAVELYKYSTSSYPEGFALLESYVSKTIPRKLRKEFAINETPKIPDDDPRTTDIDTNADVNADVSGEVEGGLTASPAKGSDDPDDENKDILKTVAILASIKGHVS